MFFLLSEHLASFDHLLGGHQQRLARPHPAGRDPPEPVIGED
jgi:hypothetical protein